jgi:hypothetical protein
MDIYNLGNVQSTMEGVRGEPLFAFNVVGVHGRPVVGFSFETQAEAAHKLMRQVVSKAKIVTPYTNPG